MVFSLQMWMSEARYSCTIDIAGIYRYRLCHGGKYELLHTNAAYTVMMRVTACLIICTPALCFLQMLVSGPGVNISSKHLKPTHTPGAQPTSPHNTVGEKRPKM